VAGADGGLAIFGVRQGVKPALFDHRLQVTIPPKHAPCLRGRPGVHFAERTGLQQARARAQRIDRRPQALAGARRVERDDGIQAGEPLRLVAGSVMTVVNGGGRRASSPAADLTGAWRRHPAPPA